MRPAPVKDPHDAAAAEAVAIRLLGRRDYSRAELRQRLERRGVAAGVVDAVIERCVERGWIDERRLAVAHALAGIAKGRGRERVVRELQARGLGGFADEAWAQALDERGGDPTALLRDEVRRRAGRSAGRLAPRDYRRVYNALLRAGHDPEAVRAELEPYREFPEDSAEG